MCGSCFFVFLERLGDECMVLMSLELCSFILLNVTMTDCQGHTGEGGGGVMFSGFDCESTVRLFVL